MGEFLLLLRSNRNYRHTWLGQVVSEIGDHFNTIAVFSLVLAYTGSGLAVSGVMIARGLAMLSAGPLAGVALDRLDRRKLMLASDLVRAVIALSFLLCLTWKSTGLVLALSALLMFASPFFTSGRAAILPTITSREELHTANSLTQTTQWTTLTIGTLLGGTSVVGFGYDWAFSFNALSFLVSAACIFLLHVPQGFRAQRKDLTEARVVRPWHEYVEGLRYIKASPLLLGLMLVHIGWATGGGAAQILFSLFGENVFHRGAAGIGYIWSSAGVGLLAGGAAGHRLGRRLSFRAYKWTISICYFVHGASYVVFSQMTSFPLALVFIGLSRAAVGVTSVLNMTQLLRHVSDAFRGRVFSTMESVVWATMILSMAAAGIASDHHSPRIIGAWSGALSASTALFWTWTNMRGKLPEPPEAGDELADVEVHGDPNV